MQQQVYAGSDWIKSAFKVEMSPLGEAVADLLGDLFLGIYHLDMKALRRVDRADNNCIVYSLGWHSLSTYDYDELTRLVILCHDRAIRCSVAASTHKYLELMFHQRQREGGYSQRHPTIEQAIEKRARLINNQPDTGIAKEMMMIYVKVFQPEHYPIIEIQLSTHNPDEVFGGYIAARKSVYPETFTIAPASVRPNISYQGDFTPEAAREISELWRIAAKTAETLDLMVKVRSDLARPISARLQVKTVVLDWQD